MSMKYGANKNCGHDIPTGILFCFYKTIDKPDGDKGDRGWIPETAIMKINKRRATLYDRREERYVF